MGTVRQVCIGVGVRLVCSGVEAESVREHGVFMLTLFDGAEVPVRAFRVLSVLVVDPPARRCT